MALDCLLLQDPIKKLINRYIHEANGKNLVYTGQWKNLQDEGEKMN